MKIRQKSQVLFRSLVGCVYWHEANTPHWFVLWQSHTHEQIIYLRWHGLPGGQRLEVKPSFVNRLV